MEPACVKKICINHFEFKIMWQHMVSHPELILNPGSNFIHCLYGTFTHHLLTK